MSSDDVQLLKIHGLEVYVNLLDERQAKRDKEILEKVDYSALVTASELKAEGWHHVGDIDVDAGIVMVGDPSYVSVDEDDERDSTKRHLIHNWHKFCDFLVEDENNYTTAKRVKHNSGHDGVGVVVSAGYGDGTYPVYVKYHLDQAGKHPDRRISELRVVFISQNEDEV